VSEAVSDSAPRVMLDFGAGRTGATAKEQSK